jgi:hypothetical protein
MILKIDELNSEVQQWGENNALAMQQAGASMGITHRPTSPSKRASLQQINSRLKYDRGLVHVVSFRVPRALIYTHKGAGKGMGGSKGSSWADKYGTTHKTASASLGKAGTGSRQAKPFINNTLSSPTGTDALGDIVVTRLGDAFVNNLLIK